MKIDATQLPRQDRGSLKKPAQKEISLTLIAATAATGATATRAVGGIDGSPDSHGGDAVQDGFQAVHNVSIQMSSLASRKPEG